MHYVNLFFENLTTHAACYHNVRILTLTVGGSPTIKVQSDQTPVSSKYCPLSPRFCLLICQSRGLLWFSFNFVKVIYQRVLTSEPLEKKAIHLLMIPIMECLSTGAAGAQTRRSLGHQSLHP